MDIIISGSLYPLKLSVEDEEQTILVCKALSSAHRIKILKLLSESSLSVKEIARLTNQPLTSTMSNITLLEDAGLIATDIIYTTIGKSRICRRTCDSILIDTLGNRTSENQQTSHEYEFPIKIASFINSVDIVAPCGMASRTSQLGFNDDPDLFFSPDRIRAQLIWFFSGFLEYRIPIKQISAPIKEISLSFEACSEAPHYDENYKSDISVLVNDIEIGTWTCPGDFGGRRGQFNPDYWSDTYTQFGLLTNWNVNESCTTLNGNFLSYRRISELNLNEQPYLSIKIGVKTDAVYKGGINLFGARFGDYAQDIILKIRT